MPTTNPLSNSLMDGAFVQLSPLGLFPHARGFQNVDRTALELLVKNFNSFLSRLGRRFVGVPFYVGHPDVRGLEHLYPDRKAYGWIMDLEVREDGLYGRPKWSEAGRDLIANGHYKFLSPYWTADRSGEHQGRPVFRPTQLISVGLTNEPNLPVLPLANSSEADLESGPANLLGEPVALLDERSSSPQSHGEHSPIANRQSSFPPSSDSPISDLEFGTSPLSSSISDLEFGISNLPSSSANSVNPLSPLCNSPSSHLTSSQSAIDNRPSDLPSAPSSDLSSASAEPLCSRCLSGESSMSEALRDLQESIETRISHLENCLTNSLLDRAIAETRIAPAERSCWQNALQADFENAARELTFAAPKLNLTSRAETLPLRPAVPGESSEKQRRVLALVNEKMRANGLSFHHAWLQTKSEHPGLIA